MRVPAPPRLRRTWISEGLMGCLLSLTLRRVLYRIFIKSTAPSLGRGFFLLLCCRRFGPSTDWPEFATSLGFFQHILICFLRFGHEPGMLDLTPACASFPLNANIVGRSQLLRLILCHLPSRKGCLHPLDASGEYLQATSARRPPLCRRRVLP